jgi:hypothetical protein
MRNALIGAIAATALATVYIAYLEAVHAARLDKALSAIDGATQKIERIFERTRGGGDV